MILWVLLRCHWLSARILERSGSCVQARLWVCLTFVTARILFFGDHLTAGLNVITVLGERLKISEVGLWLSRVDARSLQSLSRALTVLIRILGWNGFDFSVGRFIVSSCPRLHSIAGFLLQLSTDFVSIGGPLVKSLTVRWSSYGMWRFPIALFSTVRSRPQPGVLAH